jgi:hypothetical protein
VKLRPKWSFAVVYRLFTCNQPLLRGYNKGMARGWESKAVEAQIEEADSGPSSNPDLSSTADRQATLKKNDLLLSRKRILQELESSGNERYSELLRRTLAGLDAQIAGLN